MASCNKNTAKSVIIKWYIENFQFCWHKTGERLESPLFNVDFLSGTSWRLWFYPRGDDDGEYTSFYLFREEGGPEVVDVDFQLIFYDSEPVLKSARDSLNWYSFKIHQREGFECFKSRCEVSPLKADPKGTFVLRLGCAIFNRERDGFGFSVQPLFTRIGMKRIYGTEIIDNITDLDSHCNEDIVVKPLLKDDPLINIKLSYVDDSLVIKIHPVNCKEIKSAVCSITVIKNWGKEPPIENYRSWIGEIKSDIWRYRVPLPETESSIPDMKTFTHKAFFVHYVFAFATGEMVAVCGLEECSRYTTTLNVRFQQYLNVKTAKSAPTALDALEENYRTQSFVDVSVKTKTKTYPAHKAILCARSPKLKSIIGENSREINFQDFRDTDNFEHLFLFLYTDTFEISSLTNALELYILSISIDLELLKTRCRKILSCNLHNLCAALMLGLSVLYQDSLFETTVKNYIMTHYDIVLSETKWEQYADKPELRKEIILLKYKKQKTTP